MRSLSLLVACVCIVPATSHSQESKQAEDPSPKEVLARFVRVTGGKENYAKLKSYVMTGEISIPAMSAKFPLKMTGTLKPTQQVQVLDQAGSITRRYFTEKAAWEDGPMGKRLITGAERAQSAREASFLPELTPDRFYKTIKLVGKERVNGDNCYKLEMTPKVGKKEFAFYSIASGFKRRAIQTVPTPNGEIMVQTTSSDYLKVDGGLRVSFKTEQQLKPVANPTQVTNLVVSLKKCEVNKTISKDTFAIPDDIAKQVKSPAKKTESVDKK